MKEWKMTEEMNNSEGMRMNNDEVMNYKGKWRNVNEWRNKDEGRMNNDEGIQMNEGMMMKEEWRMMNEGMMMKEYSLFIVCARIPLKLYVA